MVHRNIKAIITTTALCAMSSIALAGGDFDIPWYTIDGGGGTSFGGAFELSGTIGQHDAGVMAGGTFVLSGGYWAGGAATKSPCPEDLDGSGSVGFNDLLILLAAWSDSGGPTDLDGSGIVGFNDLLILLAAWGAC